MTPLEEILKRDPTEPPVTQLQRRKRDREAAATYLAKLKAGMRTFEAVGDQTLDSPARETTTMRIAYYTERVAKLDVLISRATPPQDI